MININYNINLKKNEEAKDFNERMRNILSSNIFIKILILQFDDINSEESEEMFKKHLEKCERKEYKDYKKIILLKFIN